MLTIRALDPSVPAELEWVAQGMRATLIEVEGEAVGTAIHSPAWLRERVRWHLDHARTWTAAGNRSFIALYERHGYAIVQRAAHEGTGSPMVCLARRLDAVSR